MNNLTDKQKSIIKRRETEINQKLLDWGFEIVGEKEEDNDHQLIKIGPVELSYKLAILGESETTLKLYHRGKHINSRYLYHGDNVWKIEKIVFYAVRYALKNL